MSQNDNSAQTQQNINQVVELLRQSYGEDNGQEIAATGAVGGKPKKEKELTEAELKEKLRQQFMSDGTNENDGVGDSTYAIDEDFLREAEVNVNIDDAVLVDDIAVDDTDDAVLVDDIAVDDTDGAVLVDDIAVDDTDGAVIDDIDNDIVVDDNDILDDDIIDGVIDYDDAFDVDEDDLTLTLIDIASEDEDNSAFADDTVITDDDEDLLFDDIIEVEDDNDVTYTPIDTPTSIDFLDDDVTFDDLEAYETGNDEGPVLTKLELESEEPSIVTIIERATPEYFQNEAQGQTGAPANSNPTLVTDASSDDTEEYGGEVDDDFLNEFFSQDNDDSTEDESSVLDSVTDEIDEAELSLLMQFGYEEQLLAGYAKAEPDDNGGDDSDSEFDLEELKRKVNEKCNKYSRQRGAVLIRLAITALMAFVLLIYEGLPILGVKFGGMLSRDDFYISYLLLSLPMVIVCAIVSYRQIWCGMKKLFTRKADPYSVFVPTSVIMFFYDITVLFFSADKPPLLHFMLVCVLLSAIVWELLKISAEKKSFEFFFASLVANGESEDSGEAKEASFTLCRSRGKNSTAEKMYAGGLDADKSIYFPLEIGEKSLENGWGSIRTKSKRSLSPMLVLLPTMAFSIIVGLTALILSMKLWVFLCATAMSMLLTMPITAMLGIYLPFELLNSRGISQKYAFASEASMEEMAECDILVFEDMHLFKKAAPSSINLAIYDATPSAVLLSCLDVLYSSIGGPMSTAFAKGNTKGFTHCQINRIAKSGVEAAVEGNYSVLVGSEAFMARYGISFPNVVLKNADDRAFTLCVSINGRASARIAVRYELNPMFEMFAKRLREDGVHCVIETYDPIISTELLLRLVPKGNTPISIVHLNAANLKERDSKAIESLVFGVSEQELSLVAHSTRLNLAPALSVAKRMKKLRFRLNLLSFATCGVGALLAFLMVFFNITESINELYIFLYQLVSLGGMLALVLYEYAQKDRYSYEKFKLEKQNQANKNNK